MTAGSALYFGTVGHERMRPRRHRLRYRVFSLLLDLDELPELDRRLRLFGYNRWAPLSFHDSDHGPTRGGSLRPWAEARMREAGVKPDGGPIRLLCYPRILGYVFNPLSVYFCYRRDGALTAVLYEVCNTYSERHTYVIPVAGDGRAVIRQRCAKSLYVSPFIAMEADYHFRIVPPGDGINIVIREEDADGLLLAAFFKGARRPLTDGALARALLRFPLMTLKVIAAIHWQAVLMWAKGFRVFRHSPASRPVRSSIGTSEQPPV